MPKLSILLPTSYIWNFYSLMINMALQEVEEKKIFSIIISIKCYKLWCETAKDTYFWCATNPKTQTQFMDWKLMNKSTPHSSKSWNWMSKKFKDWTTFLKVSIRTCWSSKTLVSRFMLILRKSSLFLIESILSWNNLTSPVMILLLREFNLKIGLNSKSIANSWDDWGQIGCNL